MREIKFRAWNKKSRNFLYSDGEYGDKYFWNEVTDDYARQYGGVQQFTGLKDKNEKEIYEGDILEWKAFYVHKRWWRDTEDIPIIEAEIQKQRNEWHLEKRAVSIENGCVRAGYPISGLDIARGQFYRSGNSTNGDFEEKAWDFEIIGNISENPELLKS